MLKKLFKRTRDVFRQNIKPQAHVTYKEWQDIMERNSEAAKFDDSKIKTILEEELKHAEDIVYMNRVHEVHEERTISDVFKKVFIITKKEQVDELVGQIKFIRELLKEVESWSVRKKELERMEGLGQVIIDRGDKNG